MSISFGIVGAGMIAATHRDAIAALDGATLTGIMDRGSGLGARLAPGLDRTGTDDGDFGLAATAAGSGQSTLSERRHGRSQTKTAGRPEKIPALFLFLALLQQLAAQLAILFD